jgi:hypothetical protein
MMMLLRAIVVSALLLVGSAQAQMNSFFPGPGTVHSAGGGGCTEATTFVNAAIAADATYPNTTIDTTFICGLVNTTSTLGGSLFSRYDVLVMGATNSVAVAKINMKSPGTNDITVGFGTPGFTANGGFTSNGKTGLYSSYKPSVSAVNYTLSSGHVMYWPNNTTAETSEADVGTINGGDWIYFQANPGATGNGTFFCLSGPPSCQTTVSTTPTGRDLYVSNRTSSSNIDNYWGSGGTISAIGSQTISSSTLTSDFISIAAVNGADFSLKTISYFSIGAKFSATDITNIYNLVQARMTAVGNP